MPDSKFKNILFKINIELVNMFDTFIGFIILFDISCYKNGNSMNIEHLQERKVSQQNISTVSTVTQGKEGRGGVLTQF